VAGALALSLVSTIASAQQRPGGNSNGGFDGLLPEPCTTSNCQQAIEQLVLTAALPGGNSNGGFDGLLPEPCTSLNCNPAIEQPDQSVLTAAYPGGGTSTGTGYDGLRPEPAQDAPLALRDPCTSSSCQ
jgi:hypothetical protein